METAQKFESRAGRRRGYLYPCGTEAEQNDLIRHIATNRLGVVYAVNMGGKLTVRWADIAIGQRTPGTNRYAALDVNNVTFIKRRARVSEECAA